MTAPLSLEQKLGLHKWLSEALKAVRDDLDIQAKAWPAGARLPVIIAGEHAGWASMPKPPTSVPVTDMAELISFVAEKYPSETEVVTTVDAAKLDAETIELIQSYCPQAITERRIVRPAFLAKITGQLKDRGRFADPATGEVTEVPGVEVRIGESVPRVGLNEDAGRLMRTAWLNGQIDLSGLLELPAGPGSARPPSSGEWPSSFPTDDGEGG